MKTKAILSLILLVLVLSIVFWLGSEALLPPRTRYHTIDFENDPLYVDFRADRRPAFAPADWVQSSQSLALGIAGYPNLDNVPPEKVTWERLRDGKVIVTVLSGPAGDDSIARHETRVELVPDGAYWKIEWAGWRLQCYRGPGFGWQTAPCP